MKEKIKKEIQELLSDKKAREAIDIIKYLNYSKELDSLIMETIQEMVLEYDLYMTKHGRYMNFKDSELSKNLYKGEFQSSKGEYGFVIVPELEEDIFIPRDFKNQAMDGDLVLVSITKGEVNNRKCEGKILKILKRNPKTKVGEVVIENGRYYAILKGNRVNEKVVLKGDVSKLVDGDLVTINILNDSRGTLTHAILDKRIGHKNDPGIDIVAVLVEHDFEVEFPSDVVEELKTIPNEVSSQDLEGRVDLTHEEIFTIDGDDTKDIDDAISVKKLEDGYELGVHIADVSYYVKEDSPLDKEARKRATSVYLADRVVPMLPHQLSNGICSLNPNVIRLTISCVMKIDEKGNLIDYQVFESYIKSRKQMTYKNVNKILEENIIPDGYEEFVPILKLMHELARIIRKNKVNKGYIDFDVDEAKIIVDESAKVIDVQKRYRGVGEKLIEDFMIMANESVASYIYNMGLPGIYRVHGEVNVERLRKFISMLSILGIKINENLNNVTPKTIQRIIKEIKDLDAFQVLSTQMLSCMDKAKYQTNNIGHFALALRNYTHFTSPIRRYPDTTTHRLLREYFFKKDGITEEKINHFENILDEICLTSSERERASMECEREVEDMKMAEYMENHIGDVYDGMVSGITSFGMFIILDNLIEGLIRLDNLDDNYIYDPNTESLIGATKRKVYTIGSKVRIKVLDASKDTRRIDFILEKEEK
ncbi:MAG: ribonuclease R [Bacilli bacterium]|nr:ribonuclease R [Bacilli bacterium]